MAPRGVRPALAAAEGTGRLITLDTSGLLALFDVRDRNHRHVLRAFDADPGPHVVPGAILGEIDHLLARESGSRAVTRFLLDLARGLYELDCGERHGTPQPTTVNGAKLYLDEVGWQVDTRDNDAYEGDENVRVTSEENQAAIYAELVRFVVCDRDVAQLNFLGYYDERNRGGWQSALRRTDGSERAANGAVAAAIVETGGGCSLPTRPWSPERGVVGGAADFGDLSKARPAKHRSWALGASALEDATYAAAIFTAGTPASQIQRQLAARKAPGRLTRTRVRVIMANTCSFASSSSLRSPSSSGRRSPAPRTPPAPSAGTSSVRRTRSGRSPRPGIPIRGKGCGRFASETAWRGR